MYKKKEVILVNNENKNKYIILGRIGHGSYGKVYKAQKYNDTDTKYYAIKILKSKSSSKETQLEFIHEREIYSILSKNNNKNKYVPFLYDEGKGYLIKDGVKQDDERWFLVLDYAEKGDLYFYLEKKSNGFSERHAKLIFLKILEGIKFCHDAKICHLDIKIKNILLIDKFNPIITDFGSSEEISDKSKYIKLKEMRGTKSYMSPEMLKKGGEITFKSDIFSLGVLLLNLVTNQYGFYIADNRDENYTNICHKNIKMFWDLSNITKELSDEFKDLYIRMVLLNPKQRPTIEEILDHPWMKEIIDLRKNNPEEYKNREDEVYNEFLVLESEKNKNNEEIEIILGSNDNDSVLRGITGINLIFNVKNIKKVKMNELYVDNYVKIKGRIDKNIFMTKLYLGIEETDFKVEKYIEKSSKKLRFKLTFEKNEDENKGEEEEGLENEENDCIIMIELYQNENDEYIVAFFREKGEIEDYYHYFTEIKGIIKKDIIK